MTRILLSLPLLLLLAPAVSAQDMPLSQILIDGEGWKKAERTADAPAATKPTVVSADGGTVYSWEPGERFLHAAIRSPAGPVARSPYAPLRLKVGDKEATVSALAADRDGRIYAATPAGVQVFDPTGRLCGVVVSPGRGRVEGLAFEGDTLTAWVENATYTRRLNTSGVK